MRVLRMILSWWHQFWGEDVYWPTELDSHRWENKIEMLRRLSTGP